MLKNVRRVFGVASALAALAAPAQAIPYTSLTIFGDSLSDTGNVSALTGGLVPGSTGPYFAGRFSNGPIWTDWLGYGLGLPNGSTAWLAGGGNYAFGGAVTGFTVLPPGLLPQVGVLWAADHAGGADPNGLYVLVGGGNDLRAARDAHPGSSAADQAGRQAAAEAAIGNLAGSLWLLASSGAKHALVANVPDLGRTPEAISGNKVAASSDVSARFNAMAPALVDFGASLGLQMSFLDIAGLTSAVIADANNNGGAAYGITQVDKPCAGFSGSTGVSCNVSLFSDSLHPSARAHMLLGWSALVTLGALPAATAQRFDAWQAAAVPEPAAGGLMLLGLGLLAWRCVQAGRAGSSAASAEASARRS